MQAFIKHTRSVQLPVVVDPKGKDFEPYRGATLLTPNMSEFEAVVRHCSSEADLIDKAQRLRHALDLHVLLVTRSEQCMSLFFEDHRMIQTFQIIHHVSFVRVLGGSRLKGTSIDAPVNVKIFLPARQSRGIFPWY